MAAAKEQIRQIISENNITSVADVYSLLKESFKDILQELMEAELDASLGYEKNHKGDLATDNKRDIPPKLSKASMENSKWISPGTVTGNLSQGLSPNTRGASPALKRKPSPSMAVG